MRQAVSIAFVLILVGSGTVLAQEKKEIVRATEQIPRDSYKTWSLFLICNPNWVQPDKSRDLENLYWRFRAFGDAIGPDNLAVWFWTQQTDTRDPRLADKVDVARAAKYCRELKLRPTSGPFLIVTSDYPDLTTFPSHRAIYELGGLGPADLARLLNNLTDNLLLEHRIEAARVQPTVPSVDSSSVANTGFWVTLLESTRRSMIGFGCKLKMQVEAGPLKAELRECGQ